MKAYFALKLAGVAGRRSAHGARCATASWSWAAFRRPTATSRSTSACSIFTRGEYCPSIPPEVVLLPFNLLYQMSAWTRAIVVSLSIVHAANPRRPVPAGFNLDELWQPGVSPAFQRDPIAGSPGTTSFWRPTVS